MSVAITAVEEKFLRGLIDWYVAQTTLIWKEGTKNAAFQSVAQRAMDNLNKVADEKIREEVIATFGPNYPRHGVLIQYLSEKIQERMNSKKPLPNVSLEVYVPKPGDETLKTYLQTLESLLHVAREKEGAIRSLDGSDTDKGKDFAKRLWGVTKSARIFDFTPEDFLIAHRASDVYTTTKIAKLSWQEQGEGEPSKEETERFTRTIDEAGKRVPFPDHLPFDACYIGFGLGVPLTEDQWLARTQGADRKRNTVGVALLGYVVWGMDGGWATEIIQVVEPADNYMFPNVVCMNGIWIDPVLNLAPWIITHLVSTINDHRKLIVETKLTRTQRFDWEKRGKKMKVPGMIPKPYYVVRLEKSLIEDTGKRVRENLSRISRELAYRHDRRGHERCFIRRGKLPMDLKEVKKLTDAEYKIWTLKEPDSNAYRQLMERNQPPKAPDEWIAILTRWIDDSIVGPEHKPYIPAIRLPALDGAPIRPVARVKIETSGE